MWQWWTYTPVCYHTIYVVSNCCLSLHFYSWINKQQRASQWPLTCRTNTQYNTITAITKQLQTSYDVHKIVWLSPLEDSQWKNQTVGIIMDVGVMRSSSTWDRQMGVCSWADTLRRLSQWLCAKRMNRPDDLNRHNTQELHTGHDRQTTHTHNRLMTLCLGLLGWAGTIRNFQKTHNPIP